MKYSEKLRDPRWQKKRLKILERDEWACQGCYDSESMLSVHHRRYIKGLMPWEYPGHLLITLCPNCHDEERATRSELEQEFLELLKERFLVRSLPEIIEAFQKLPSTFTCEITASIINYALTDGYEKSKDGFDEYIRRNSGRQ